MTKLPQRIVIERANRDDLNDMATEYHYMHRPVHQRACPFGYRVSFDGQDVMPDGKPAGFVIFASIHFTRQRGLFGYEALPTKWQVLSLARLWLHDDLPHNSETVVLSKLLAVKGTERISRVGWDWLQVHPPVDPAEPYHIRLIISYSDRTHGHNGTIYRAANFTELRTTKSAARHKNTRGGGMDGHELIQFIYRLPEPKITLMDVPGQLHLQLFEGVQS